MTTIVSEEFLTNLILRCQVLISPDKCQVIKFFAKYLSEPRAGFCQKLYSHCTDFRNAPCGCGQFSENFTKGCVIETYAMFREVLNTMVKYLVLRRVISFELKRQIKTTQPVATIKAIYSER